MKAPTPFNLTETPLTRGASLIEASAGTGKTYTITALFVRLIVEESLSVREILAVTYTEAATSELRHRVRQALVRAGEAFASGESDVPFLKALVARYRKQSGEMEARLQNALCGFDEAPIYTIHGFCQRTLRDRAFESGLLFDTELVTDPSEFLQGISDDFWRRHFYEAGPTLVNFALKIGLGPERFLGLLRTCTNYPRIEFVSQAKGRALESLSAELEGRYLAARGVWHSEAGRIKACFGSTAKWGNTPYNNDASMAARFDQLDTCFSESDTAFEALACLEDFCATRLQERKAQRSKDALPAHRFFELCDQLRKAEQIWLAGIQLAFVEYARAELPRRKAERKIQYFDDLLTRLDGALSGPGGEALATDLFGVDGCQLAECAEARWHEWLQLFHDYLELWGRYGFFRMFRLWLQRQQVRQRLLAFPDGERRLTNILHLGEVLHQAEAERRLGIAGLLKWLAQQMDQEEEAPEEHQLRLERDDNAVRIVTVHKSKGLEYPVVFCLFSWKDSDIKRGSEELVFFHDPAQGHRLVRDLGPDIADEHRQQARRERLAENVRLLYVALTRAGHRCYFAWGGIRGAGTSAPSWLFHRPPAAGGPLLETLEAHFKSLSDEAMLGDLAPLSERSGGALNISNLPEPANVPYKAGDGAGTKLECRQFKGRIQRDWVISSFTYFKAGLPEELPDRDGVGSPKAEEAPGEGIFAFPKGTKAGSCLHEMLEKLDFNATGEEMAKLVNQRLEAHGLAQAGNSEGVQQMLKALLRFPLAPARKDFTLSRLNASDRLNELEFYFPVRGVAPARLQELLGRLEWSSAVPAQLDRLAFDPMQGFLKGFIDLVFRFEDRFYLVDWKSNWLGNRMEDYSPDAIRNEMRQEYYFIQCHLYTVALHKYLAMRVPGYDYERHFGGVIYPFLRGLDPDRPERGAYRDRPPRSAVDQLSALLEGR